MRPNNKMKMLGLAVCGLLAACGSSRDGAGASASRAPLIDNDSYYIQPGSYMPAPVSYGGCNQINDAPSCGGG